MLDRVAFSPGCLWAGLGAIWRVWARRGDAAAAGVESMSLVNLSGADNGLGRYVGWGGHQRSRRRSAAMSSAKWTAVWASRNTGWRLRKKQ